MSYITPVRSFLSHFVAYLPIYGILGLAAANTTTPLNSLLRVIKVYFLDG
jgi:hypothetical protein